MNVLSTNIPHKELDDRQNSLLIHFSIYTYQEIHSKHGIIPNGPSLCRICEENGDINNDLIERPIYGKKKHFTKIHVLLENSTRCIIN